MSFRIRSHGELQSAVLRATLAGGAYGLVHWRFSGPAGQVLGVVAIGIAAVPPRSWRSAMVAAAVAVLAGASTALGGVAGLVALAAIGGLTFARDLDGPGRRAVAALCGSAGLAAGWFVAAVLGGSTGLAAVPPALSSLMLGAAAGFIAALGTTGRLLEWSTAVDEVAAAAPPATAIAAEGELGGLLARATCAFRDAESALGGQAPEARAAAADLLGRIVRFGTHFRDLDRESSRIDRVALCGRLDEITAREHAASDDVVRAEYARARGALREQLDYLDGIERGRDRAVARLHHHIAVLERLRLAALHHRSADATRVGDELAPLVEDIASAGRDLDYAAEALAELPAG